MKNVLESFFKVFLRWYLEIYLEFFIWCGIKNVILKFIILKFMMFLRDIVLIYCFFVEFWFKFFEYFLELISKGFRLEDIFGNGVW